MRSATTTGVQEAHKSLRLEIAITFVISHLIEFLIISAAIRNLFSFYSLCLALTSKYHFGEVGPQPRLKRRKASSNLAKHRLAAQAG